MTPTAVLERAPESRNSNRPGCASALYEVVL